MKRRGGAWHNNESEKSDKIRLGEKAKKNAEAAEYQRIRNEYLAQEAKAQRKRNEYNREELVRRKIQREANAANAAAQKQKEYTKGYSLMNNHKSGIGNNLQQLFKPPPPKALNTRTKNNPFGDLYWPY